MGVCNTKNDNSDLIANNINLNAINKLEKNICKIYKPNGSIETGLKFHIQINPS